ncbi:MAG: prenyltransferase/squalene oxidase repeat-containing protein, partial [Gemmataceae bacterium]
MLRYLIAVAAGGLLLSLRAPARADDLPAKHNEAVDKGLQWLAKQQFPDGHWEAQPGQPYSVAMTGLAGMAFLMEGSTLREGKYQVQIRKAVGWFLSRSQPNGLLGKPSSGLELMRYMYGHGYGLMFLACAYGEEEEGDRRKKLEDVLTRAVEFTAKSQSSTGGWNYVSGADTGNDAGHEGSVTIVQVQSLRAARNAGIAVPQEAIKKAYEYLKKATDTNGGVMYQLGQPPGRGPLTAQGIACLFSTGEYDDPLVKTWLPFAQKEIPLDGSGVDRYGHY